jgi:phosphoglycerate-specific signal transduction histidine kinase
MLRLSIRRYGMLALGRYSSAALRLFFFRLQKKNSLKAIG